MLDLTTAVGYHGTNPANQEVRPATPLKEGCSAFSFPLSNDAALEVPVLNALRAGLTLANLLDCANSYLTRSPSARSLRNPNPSL